MKRALVRRKRSELSLDLEQIAKAASKSILLGVQQVTDQALLAAIARLRTRIAQNTKRGVRR